MKYMLLIYGDENALSQEEREACYGESSKVAHDIASLGKFFGASPLQHTSTARSVRVRDGKRLVTDGPFAETHEQLGGFFMVDAANEEEALEFAARIPGAKFGTVEVRPIVELSGLPDSV